MTIVETAISFLSPYLGTPLAWLVAGFVVAAVTAGVVSGFTSVAVYVERKLSAFMQCRVGPMEIGPNFPIRIGKWTILPPGWYGLGTLISDSVKLLTKEDIIPANADPVLFRLSPYIVFTGTLVAFAVIPWGPYFTPGAVDGGILVILAASSVGILGLVMGGYASNNKWSLYGAIRSIAQVVSYEVPMGLALLAVVVTVGSLNLTTIVEAQKGWIWRWHVFSNPWLLLATICYFITALAETNRTPFDLPEAESELVAGYHTEYSGMRFAIFFLSEYSNMLLVSLVCVVGFLGGYYTGLPFLDDFWILAPVVLLVKACAVVGMMMLIRWTVPRYRVDKLMEICWKGLIPVTLLAFCGAGFSLFFDSPAWGILGRLVIIGSVVIFARKVFTGLSPMPKRSNPV